MFAPLKRIMILAIVLMLPAAAFAEEHPSTAEFRVTKDFEPTVSTSVTVTLSCNHGHLSEPVAVISEGSPHTFVVEDLPLDNDEVVCTITENTQSGYTASYDDDDGLSGTSCTYNGDDNLSESNDCDITNTAKDATFTVTKTWEVVGDGGNMIDKKVQITVQCNNSFSRVTGPLIDHDWHYKDKWFAKYKFTGEDTIVISVDSTDEKARCSATEEIFDSAVESSGSCNARDINPGSSSGCIFTNTVFFEGIPTLNQYGLAIMALLMLGVGFVGFRRFV